LSIPNFQVGERLNGCKYPSPLFGMLQGNPFSI